MLSPDLEPGLLDALGPAARATAWFTKASTLSKQVTAGQAAAGNGDKSFLLKGNGSGYVSQVVVNLFFRNSHKL
jgi:hypothetical protein